MEEKVKEPLFAGLVVSVMGDAGPQMICSIAPPDLDEITLLNMNVQGMTLLGLADGVPENKLHGPVPVPTSDKYQSLVYSFIVEAKVTKDERMQTFGVDSVLFILFKANRLREILGSYGIIESLLSRLVQNIKTENDLADFEKMREILDSLRYASFGLKSRILEITEDGELKEIVGATPSTPVILIVDVDKHVIFVAPVEDNVSHYYRSIGAKSAMKLNLKDYKNAFKIEALSSINEARPLLEKFKITPISYR